MSLTDWNSLEPYFEELEERPLDTRADLEKWLFDMSELEAVLSEDICWRQIKMTCDTENKSLEEAFNYFCLEIQPKIQPYADRLNKRLVENPHTQELDPKEYFSYLRSVRKRIELVSGANIPCMQRPAYWASSMA
jgi:oligoendopeptidase F